MTTLEEAMERADGALASGNAVVMVTRKTLDAILSALRSRPTREDVARVIDPWAFENVPHRGRLMRKARALADAQAVLRLFEGGE